jgi:hypothetical protein
MNGELINDLGLRGYYDACPPLQTSLVASYVEKPRRSHRLEATNPLYQISHPHYDKMTKVEGQAMPLSLAVLVSAQSHLGDSMNKKSRRELVCLGVKRSTLAPLCNQPVVA